MSEHLKLSLSLEKTRFPIGLLDPGTQPEPEPEGPEPLAQNPTEAELMRINWAFLCTRLRVIGSLATLTFFIYSPFNTSSGLPCLELQQQYI